MATVPGDPMAPTQQLPDWAQGISMAHFLQAAAIVDQKQRLAGDVLQIDMGDWLRLHGAQQLGRAKSEGAGGYIESDPNAVAKGVMSGKVKILTPTGEK